MRSDDIGNLTAAGREDMQAYGVTTVIDLRSQSEVNGSYDPRFPRPRGEKQKVAGVTYVQRPLVDDASLKKLGEAENMYERYLVMLNTRQESFCSIFTSIAETEGGVLFHCFAGKDRTGLVAALLLDLAGVPAEHIAADFAETDLQMAQQYERWISATPPDKQEAIREDLRCPPERILGVLDFLQTRWGGVPGYLEASGMTLANIDRLASKLA